MNFQSFSDEFLKLSAITREEAEKALTRLKELEATRPSAGEIARGALAGTAAGLSSQLASGLVKGTLVNDVKDVLSKAPDPTLKGKAKALGLAALKSVGGTAAGSAAFGSVLPFAKGRLDRAAETKKLREFLKQHAAEQSTGPLTGTQWTTT